MKNVHFQSDDNFQLIRRVEWSGFYADSVEKRSVIEVLQNFGKN